MTYQQGDDVTKSDFFERFGRMFAAETSIWRRRPDQVASLLGLLQAFNYRPIHLRRQIKLSSRSWLWSFRNSYRWQGGRQEPLRVLGNHLYSFSGKNNSTNTTSTSVQGIPSPGRVRSYPAAVFRTFPLSDLVKASCPIRSPLHVCGNPVHHALQTRTTCRTSAWLISTPTWKNGDWSDTRNWEPLT